MRSLAALAVPAVLLPALSAAGGPPRLEGVVVTATFRAVPLEELPASATVLDRRVLAEAATQHLEELLPQVPSLSWAGASSRPRYFQLRGIGELEQYQGAPNPSVGFLVDEIDFSGIGIVATLFDVEQVEILRGPQGTRCGANALAGLIKVSTREPVPEPELVAEATLGGDAMTGAGLAAGGAIGEAGSAWRLAVQHVFSASKNPEAAWKWISWLSKGPNNVIYNKAAGQMTVTKSGAANWTLHPKRFVVATVNSLPIAAVLPSLPQTADFTRVVWPQTTQKALLGQIQPDEMMQTFEKLFFG